METVQRDLIKNNSTSIDEVNIRTYLAMALKSVGLDPNEALSDFMGLSPYGHNPAETEAIIELSDRLEAIIEPMFLFGYDNEAKTKTRMLCENLALKLYAIGVTFTDRELETIISTFLSYSSNFQIFSS